MTFEIELTSKYHTLMITARDHGSFTVATYTCIPCKLNV